MSSSTTCKTSHSWIILCVCVCVLFHVHCEAFILMLGTAFYVSAIRAGLKWSPTRWSSLYMAHNHQHQTHHPERSICDSLCDSFCMFLRLSEGGGWMGECLLIMLRCKHTRCVFVASLMWSIFFFSCIFLRWMCRVAYRESPDKLCTFWYCYLYTISHHHIHICSFYS